MNIKDVKFTNHDKGKIKNKNKSTKSFKLFYEDGKKRRIKTKPYKRTKIKNISFKDFIEK